MAGLRTSSGSLVRGLRVEESYAVFQAWDFDKNPEENFETILQNDVMGNASGYSQKAFLSAIKRRFDFTGADRALVEMAKRGVSFDIFRPVLLWHTARREVVLHLFLTDWLYQRFSDGILYLRAEDVRPFTASLASRGVIPKRWSQASEHRVASALLTMAKEAGLVKGHIRREFTPYHLPDDAFLYLLHAMSEVQPNAHAVVHSPDWRMYLMDVSDVERELFRLHQYRRVHYEVAGTLAQLSLPCATAAAFVEEMAL
ncbi:MAG: DUF1819 family protein [Deltaproteobacteria bacterium]|nr:MAG: DUF1819 family protein [Deltaproteobacteria bacterium]